MVSETQQQPTLVLNPPDDVEFRSSAERLVEDGLIDAAGLQGRLRERWPLAIVHRRELVGEQSQTWYVYRDGRWVHPGR